MTAVLFVSCGVVCEAARELDEEDCLCSEGREEGGGSGCRRRRAGRREGEEAALSKARVRVRNGKGEQDLGGVVTGLGVDSYFGWRGD